MRSAILGFLAGGLLIAGLAASTASPAPQASQPKTPPAVAPAPPPAVAQPPATTQRTPTPATPPATAQPPAAAQPSAAEAENEAFNQRAIAEVQKMIAGKEEQPAETVFKNIQSFKGVPAGRVPRIMGAFSHALGVSCKKCHDTENWASDDKSEKKAARGMMQMTKDINEKYLKTIPGLDEDAVVNCTTCHRGQVDPNAGLGGPPRR